MESENQISSETSGIRVYKYRWIQLIIFCLFTVNNFMQFLQFTIISNIVSKYYDVGSFLVDVTGLIFFLTYIVLFLPISYLIEKYNLKVTAIVSTGLTLIGNLIKILCGDKDRFYVVLIGQTFCAIGQVYMLSIPSKFASIWFGPDEVSMACALAVLGTQLGAALGSVLPPFLVKTDDEEKIGENLRNMMIYNASASLVIFILVVAFFKARPRIPPSLSQLQLLESSEENGSFFKNCKTLIKQKDFILLLVAFGIFNGTWNSFGIIVNKIYISYFPDGEHDVGIITLISIISGGCIGSLIFGIILDKTHQFKKISFVVMILACLAYVLVVYTIVMKNRIGSYISMPLFGFFMASGLVISFEYALELTYPIPESVSCSVLNAVIFLFAIICSTIFDSLLDLIGFLYGSIEVEAILLLCVCVLFFISSKLRRREANLASGQDLLSENNENANE